MWRFIVVSLKSNGERFSELLLHELSSTVVSLAANVPRNPVQSGGLNIVFDFKLLGISLLLRTCDTTFD